MELKTYPLYKVIEKVEVMGGQELLKLSGNCYKILRRKYPARVRWTPEFEAWRRFLEEQVGGKARDLH